MTIEPTATPARGAAAPERTAADEWDELAHALNRYGIRHIAPHSRPRRVPSGEELIFRLQRSDDVRLREALIPLLLTHPELDDVARRAIDRLDGDERRRAALRYAAACALQGMWWTRLGQELGPRRRIEPAYLDELGLPPLDIDFGQATLAALSRDEEARYGHDAWAGYTSLMDLFLNEIRDPAWGKPIAARR